MGDLVRFPSTPEPWMNKNELARHLRISPGTVSAYMRQGMPHQKLGTKRNSRVRFKASWADKWVSEMFGEVS